MKKFLQTVLVLLSFTLMAGVASSASAASFMKIDGIKGESKDPDHKDWIEIVVEAWDQVPAIPFQGPSHFDVGSVSISKDVDMSSTKLFQVCANGKTMDTVEVHMSVSVEDHRYPYRKFVLFDVAIEDCEVDDDKESMTLNFSSIETNYTLADDKRRIEELASRTENERQKRMMDAAAAATGRAAEADDKGDEEAAANEISAAITFLTEAARECADVKKEVMSLAAKLKAQGGISDTGIKNLGLLFDLLDKAKKNKASGPGGSFEQSAAIREIILGIYSILDNGFHDFWHTKKALDWYINAISSGYSGHYDRDMIKELLDYLMDGGDMRPEKKAEILEELDEFVDKVKNDRKNVDIISETRRIKDLIQDEIRHGSAARKAADRKAAEAEEEAERAQQQSGQSSAAVPDPGRQAPQPTTAVQFTSLEGPTEVSRRTIGEVQSVHIIAIDGTEIKPDKEPEFTDHKDSITINFPWDPADISSVIFGGALGTLEIFQDRWAPDDTFGFGPRDREIVTRNTTVNETIVTKSPTGEGLVTGALDDYAVTIDGQPVDIVATQPDEITIQGSGIQPNPSGQSDVVLTEQGIPIASGTFDSWGYTVSAQPVTERNVWIPIYLQVTGVEPIQFLRVTLKPTKGQIIEPTEVVVSGAEVQETTQIARLKTDKLGPQLFFVTIEKMD